MVIPLPKPLVIAAELSVYIPFHFWRMVYIYSADREFLRGSEHENKPHLYGGWGYGIGQSTQYTTWSTNVVAPQAMTMTHVPPPYEDYTGRAMFAAFCCCWPLGLWALLKASEARKSYQVGDSETARSQADQARQLSNISIGVGCASFVLLFTFIVLYYTVILYSFSDWGSWKNCPICYQDT